MNRELHDKGKSLKSNSQEAVAFQPETIPATFMMPVRLS